MNLRPGHDRDVPTVFLLRHGRTALNAAGLLRGRRDVDLDAIGQLEAARLAALFAGVALTAVVASPMRRAVQTATPIALLHHLEVQTDDDLIDRDYGEWAGQPADEVRRRFGTIDAAPGVESRAAFEHRLRRTFERWSTHAGPVLLVGHDAVNAALLRLVLDDQDEQDVVQHTGCWNELVFDGLRWRGVAINQVPRDAPPVVGEPR